MSSDSFPADSSKAFSIVIVNYKTPEITKICLDLLHQHVGSDSVPIWVVDNYSADESTEYLRTLEWINLIERSVSEPEPGHIAHGKALDLVLERVETDYLFLCIRTHLFSIKMFFR